MTFYHVLLSAPNPDGYPHGTMWEHRNPDREDGRWPASSPRAAYEDVCRHRGVDPDNFWPALVIPQHRFHTFPKPTTDKRPYA